MSENATTAWGTFPPQPLRDYAFIADGRRGALVGPRGDVAWLCVPRWDSPAVCSAIVGGAGMYAVSPVRPGVCSGAYEPGTQIWRRRWVTETADVELHEALALPVDVDCTVLLRRVAAVDNDAPVRIELDLRAGFGSDAMTDLKRDDTGDWIGRTGDLAFRWQDADDAEATDRGLALETVLPRGSHRDLVLSIGAGSDLPPIDAERAWERTRAAWRAAVPDFGASAAPRDARLAYAVMTGLTTPEGGMVAAPTLGLPERPRASGNYDYRYAWIRDQAYAGQAAGVDEPLPLLDDAVAITTARLLEHGPDLSPAYRVDGSEIPEEVPLDLPGYPGAKAICGNWVRKQFQLDTLGEVLQLFGTAARHDHLNSDAHRAAMLAVDLIERRWQEPDAGIWELDDRWWTHSRLACVAGLRTLACMLSDAEARRHTALADAILAEASRRCLDRRGAWVQYPSATGTDAALLIAPVRGALPPDDPRVTSTLAAVLDELTEDGYVYRFRHGDQPLGHAEGAFLLCGFFAAMAHWHRGEEVDAVRWFERSRAACGPPGLFAEEFNVQRRTLAGNLPQAFVHAAMLETATRLGSEPQEAS